MKKLFNKILAGVTTVALVAALVLGVSVAQSSADDVTPLTLGKVTFIQGGHVPDNYDADAGYFNSVQTADGEQFANWERGFDREQTWTSNNASNGFSLDIEETGWDALWDAHQFNPWSIRAKFTDATSMVKGHMYQVKFKAKASKTKNFYITFNTTVDGHEMAPYDTAPLKPGSSTQTNVMNVAEQEYVYTFTNYVGGQTLSTEFMLGAFIYTTDYAGNDVSSIISPEQNWKGTVQVSNYTVTDLGVDPDAPTDPAPPTQATTSAPQPTQAPTQAPTVKPSPTPAKTLAKVTKVKVKSVKKKTIKVTWKKVANAKSYQIKVGNKTYKATKNFKKIKNKKFKKGKKVKVKVRAMAAGYKTGAWSKTVKKKLTK